LNFQPIFPNQIVIQDNISDRLTKQNMMSDTKYQDIIYHMHNIDKTVESKEKIHIDFLKAMNEMEKIDWKYVRNYIGFTNERTEECIQFVRVEKDKWYAEALIGHGKDWKGYVWYNYSNSKTLVNMLRLFFEEVSWFGMLSWKLKRLRKYATD